MFIYDHGFFLCACGVDEDQETLYRKCGRQHADFAVGALVSCFSFLVQNCQDRRDGA